MNILTKVVIATLAGLFFSAGTLIPSHELTGKIVETVAFETGPVQTRAVTVDLPKGKVTALIYEDNGIYKNGDRVLLRKEVDSGQYFVTDYLRTDRLLQLFILFLLAVVIVSGVSGLRSLLGLFASFVVIFAYVLPQIVGGANPLLVTLIAATAILFTSYYLTHGISIKTNIALAGTLLSLGITGVLTIIYGELTKLTGLGSEEASFLLGSIDSKNIYNLLLAGMIIGTLGVLDDITIAQASIVQELANANKKLGMKELFVRGMKVGHDHIASVVNTLVLVYAGSALPLLLLFTQSQASAIELLNYEMVAEEIVRTLVGSIGLVSAVPITTALAAYWYGQKLFFDKEHKQDTK